MYISLYLCTHMYFPWLNYEHRCFMNALFACLFQFSNHNKNRNVFTMLFYFSSVQLILILEWSIVYASDILYLCLQIASRKAKAMITAAKYYDMLYKARFMGYHCIVMILLLINNLANQTRRAFKK